jgi:hypothetical protein
MEELSKCRGFQWDEGNSEKNWLAHKVTRAECEQVFFNRPLVSPGNDRATGWERRYYLLGQTDAGRRLFIVFTIRGDLVRVISARDMSRGERGVYQHAKEQADTEV